MIECDNGAFYTGITKDVQRRFAEHASVQTQLSGEEGREVKSETKSKVKSKGAKYFRRTKPVRIVFQQAVEDRSIASKMEYAIKKLSNSAKQAISR